MDVFSNEYNVIFYAFINMLNPLQLNCFTLIRHQDIQ